MVSVVHFSENQQRTVVKKFKKNNNNTTTDREREGKAKKNIQQSYKNLPFLMLNCLFQRIGFKFWLRLDVVIEDNLILDFFFSQFFSTVSSVKKFYFVCCQKIYRSNEVNLIRFSCFSSFDLPMFQLRLMYFLFFFSFSPSFSWMWIFFFLFSLSILFFYVENVIYVWNQLVYCEYERFEIDEKCRLKFRDSTTENLLDVILSNRRRKCFIICGRVNFVSGFRFNNNKVMTTHSKGNYLNHYNYHRQNDSIFGFFFLFLVGFDDYYCWNKNFAQFTQMAFLLTKFIQLKSRNAKVNINWNWILHKKNQ